MQNAQTGHTHAGTHRQRRFIIHIKPTLLRTNRSQQGDRTWTERATITAPNTAAVGRDLCGLWRRCYSRDASGGHQLLIRGGGEGVWKKTGYRAAQGSTAGAPCHCCSSAFQTRPNRSSFRKEDALQDERKVCFTVARAAFFPPTVRLQLFSHTYHTHIGRARNSETICITD